MIRRGNRTPLRSNLRLTDLKERWPHASKLMNVKLPGDLVAAIDRLAGRLDATKTETVLMLLNEGLARSKRGKRS